MVKLINSDYLNLKEYVKDKTVLCFGAGTVCKNFCAAHPDFRINAVIDNNPQRQGEFFQYNDKAIKIIGIEEAKNISNAFLLISCADIGPILEQLDHIPEFNDVPCAAVYYVESETNWVMESKKSYAIDYKVLPNETIPRQIHYCWFGGAEIPELNKRCIDSWRKMCPDYEIFLWNEDNYDVNKNIYMKQAYEHGKWSFVTDYARMDILYNHGGIYFDTDVELIRNIDHLLYQKGFVGVDSTKRISSGLGMGAVKGNVVFREILDKYENIQFDINNMVPCPEIEKSVYEKLGFVKDGSYQVFENMTVYPEKVLSGKCDITGRILTTSDTVAIHHFDGSWNDEKKRNRRMVNKKIYHERVKEI